VVIKWHQVGAWQIPNNFRERKPGVYSVSVNSIAAAIPIPIGAQLSQFHNSDAKQNPIVTPDFARPSSYTGLRRWKEGRGKLFHHRNNPI